MKKILLCLMVAALLLAGCATKTAAPVDDGGLEKAKGYVFNLYNKGKGKVAVSASDFQVVASVMINGVSYPVEWSADCAEESVKVVPAENNKVTIDVNEQSPVDVSYNLTATITDASGKSVSISFPYSIPAFKELSWAEYAAAAKDDTVVVKGVVTGIMSKTKGNSTNCLYLQDSVGGYYVYGLSLDPVEQGIEIGMTVRATGKKDVYSGTLEIASASIEILDGGKNIEAPVDWTEKYTAASSLKDEALTKEQALLVTVKGVTVTGQDTGSGYYRFRLGDLESYVRISSSVCPVDKNAQTALKEGHAEHYGWIANVTGVICVYDGAFYLSPVEGWDAFEYVSLPELSDSEKVAFELDAIADFAAVTADSSVALVSKGVGYEAVVIEWESDSECAVVEGGTVTFTLPEEETVVTLTATAKVGDAALSKEFKVSVDAASSISYSAVKVTEPEKGRQYVLYTYQGNISSGLFFQGELASEKYLATSDKGAKAKAVMIEEAEGGFRIYFIQDGAKAYVEIVEGVKAAINAEPQGNVWTINENGIPVTMVGDTEYYLGCYKTYNTFSASKTSYIADASVIGVSQFPMVLGVKAVDEKAPVTLSSVEAGDTVVYGTYQANIGAQLYFDGTLSGKYLGTTEKIEKAAAVTVEAAEGGFALSVEAEGAKKYIGVAGGQAVLADAPVVWNLNENNVAFTTLDGTDYYLGCYKTYNTMSASKTSYIADASVIGVSQFPGVLSRIETAQKVWERVVSEEDLPETVVLSVEQNNIGEDIYFNGNLSGKYLSTGTFEKAATVTIVKAEGGFKMVNTDGQYIGISGGQAVLTEGDGSLWNLNESGIPVTVVDGTEYYLGCYKTYNTFSASKTSYIADTSVIGVSQFPMFIKAN